MSADLVQFLRDRLDEDQRNIEGGFLAAPLPTGFTGLTREGTAYIHEPVQLHLLRDLDAKRELIKRGDTLFCDCDSADGPPMDPDSNWTVPIPHHYDCTAYLIAQELALIYADHPEYRDEWRP